MRGKLLRKPTSARHNRGREKHVRRCNICGRLYRAQTNFQRFCAVCRREEDLLHYGDWLPELDVAISPVAPMTKAP